MLIETYKGVQVFHNASKDEFYTHLVVIATKGDKKDEILKHQRLQGMRDMIDKYLAVSTKKPTIPKGWYKGKYSSDPYEKVDVILYSTISDTVIVRKANGKEVQMKKGYSSGYDEGSLYLACKKNEALIKAIVEKQKSIDKIKKEVSCTSGKLLPFTKEHFS